MPLLQVPTQAAMLEPEVNSIQMKRAVCKHLIIKDYKCSECNQLIASFKSSMFDTGGITTYLNIKYVNEFVDQYESNNNGMTLGRPKVIYENYKPKNVYEMREYILYTIDKSLTKALKRGQISNDHIKALGKPGSGKNLSTELISYIIFKRNKEKRLLCKTDEDLKDNKGEQQNDDPNNAEQQKEIQLPYSAIGPHCLLFDSFFECGNLEKAEYVGPTEYNLYLNVDTNTKGHQQWFYFKVKNTFKDKKYTFHIRNFTKPFSLHRSGMKILMRSKKKQIEEGKVNLDSPEDWVPVGEEMCYWKTDIQRSGWRIPGALNLDDEEDADEVLDDLNVLDGMAAIGGNQVQSSSKKPGQDLKGIRPLNVVGSQIPIGAQGTIKKKRRYFYCLTFKVEFEFDDDKVYFAYSRPYPYSKIYSQVVSQELAIIASNKSQGKNHEKDLKVVDSSDRTERHITTKEIFYQRSLLGKTISGLPVPVITITSRKHKGLEFRKRQGICITARVHPGETNSNFVYDGLMQYLLTPDGSFNLLQNYVFKLIPCLNPDGNVCGNYRSSLAGVDLNRQWIYPSKDIHPIIFKAKEMMAQFSKERNFLVYCDLHCHSKKKNSFIYGCNTAANGGFTSWTKTRLLPRIFAKQTPLFNFKDCRFRVDPDKLGTARVIVWREFGVTNSFTLENSFYGYQIGDDTIPFLVAHYLQIGENLMRSLIEYRMCLKQIEKELIVSNGWLKPKLLIEVTGTPAAQKMAEEQAEMKRKALKVKKMEMYMQNLGLVGKKTTRAQSPYQRQKVSEAVVEPMTRNIQKNNTLAQQIVTPKTAEGDHSSQERGSKSPYQRQGTNRSEQKILLVKTTQQVEKRQSSSDSTNEFSNRKFNNLTSHSIQGIQGRNIEGSNQDGQKKSQINARGNRFQKDISRKNSMKSSNASPSQTRSESQEGNGDNLSDSQNAQPVKLQVKMNTNSKKKQTNSAHKRNQSVKVGIKQQKTIKKHIQSSQKVIEEVSKDWRAYFLGEELEEIYEQIEEGDDPNDYEENMSMSDDCASDDNLDFNELYQEIYLRANLMDQELLDAKKAEELHSVQMKKEIEQSIAIRRKIILDQSSKKDEEYLESDDEDQQSLKSGEINSPQIQYEPIGNISQIEQSKSQITNKQHEPLSIQSHKAKLNNPVLGDKKKTSNDQINQYNIPISKSNEGQSQEIIGDESTFAIQQILDTSQDQQIQRAQAMYTFVNQQAFAHIGHPGKVMYRKGNLDLIQNKFPHNSPEFKGQDYLQKYRMSFNSSSGNGNASIIQQKNNGFQQYIQHSIKHEKQSIQQAYNKINNNQTQQKQISLNKSSINTQSFYNNNSGENLPHVSSIYGQSLHGGSSIVDASLDNFIEIHMNQYSGTTKKALIQNPTLQKPQVDKPIHSQGKRENYNKSQKPQQMKGQVLLLMGSPIDDNRLDIGSFDMRPGMVKGNYNALPSLRAPSYQGIDSSSNSNRQMQQKKFFQGSTTLNQNLNSHRKDLDQNFTQAYSAIATQKKLSNSVLGNIIYQSPQKPDHSSSLSMNSPYPSKMHDLVTHSTIQVLKQSPQIENQKNMRQHRRVTQIDLIKGGGLNMISQAAGLNIGLIPTLQKQYKY